MSWLLRSSFPVADPEFLFLVILLWPPKATESSLPCYVTPSLGEKKLIHAFSKGICAKVMQQIRLVFELGSPVLTSITVTPLTHLTIKFKTEIKSLQHTVLDTSKYFKRPTISVIKISIQFLYVNGARTLITSFIIIQLKRKYTKLAIDLFVEPPVRIELTTIVMVCQFSFLTHTVKYKSTNLYLRTIVVKKPLLLVSSILTGGSINKSIAVLVLLLLFCFFRCIMFPNFSDRCSSPCNTLVEMHTGSGFPFWLI